MKQYITTKQLSELSEKGRKKLRKWWEPRDLDKFWGEEYGESAVPPNSTVDRQVLKEWTLPLLSIGQMIEFLGNDWWNGLFWACGNCSIYEEGFEGELSDALWEAVKEKLEK